MRTVRWISDSIGKKKWMIVALCVFQGALAVSGVVFALLMRRTIDSAVAGNHVEFWQAGGMLTALIFVQILLRAGNRYLEEDTRAAMDNCLRRKVFGGILHNEYAKVTSYHTGELMNRLTSDTQIVTDGTVTLIPSLLSMGIRIIGVLVVMYTIEPWFTFIFLIGGCLMAGVSLFPRRWLKRLHRRVQETDGKVRSFLQECLESLLVIHAFGCEEKMEEKSADKMAEHRRIRRKRSNLSNLFSTGLSLVMQGGYLLGFIWCGFGILQGRISYGTLTAVIQLIGQIQTPFANLGSVFPKFTSMLASAERLAELTEQMQESVETSPETLTAFPRIEGKSREWVYEQMQEICFDQVSFRYDLDRQVLNHDSFVIPKGEFVAMIGSSGIGKSTIMKLLLSVYQPEEGKIVMKLVDGEVPLGVLPSGMFAYVPQGNHLMSGTIAEVVGFAQRSGEIDRERVVEACKAACADGFIRELPQGYDTLLGEKGAGLSEGQMQRLAVARAVYSECPILLLDEATSALDGETERQLIASLKKLPGRTVLLVTHRKEAWKLCDRVLERKE